MRQLVQGSVTQPLAGHDFSFVPETADSFSLLSLRAKLVTSATAANRFPHFQVTDQTGTVLHEITGAAAQTATSTVVYNVVGRDGSSRRGEAVVDGVASLPWPGIWYPAGSKILTLTTAIDTGDQWSAIAWTALVGDEWEHLQLLDDIAGAIGS